MSTRSTVRIIELPGVDIHIYRELTNGRYMVAIGRTDNAYPRIAIPLTRRPRGWKGW